VDIGGKVNLMYPLRLIPQLCRCLGIKCNETEWADMCGLSMSTKKLAVLSKPSGFGPGQGQVESADSISMSDSVFSRLGRLGSSSTSGLSDDSNSLSSISALQRSQSCDSVDVNVSTKKEHEKQQQQMRQQIAKLERANEILKKACVSKNKMIRGLQKKLKGFHEEANVKTLKAFKKKQAFANSQSQGQLSVDKKARGDRNLSDSGRIAVALRMSLSSCSALGFPAASWSDISRQTVSRCEVNSAAACMIRGALVGHALVQALTKSKTFFVRPLAIPFLQQELFLMKPFMLRQDREQEQDSVRERLEAFFSWVKLPLPIVNPFMGDLTGGLSVAGISLQNDATNSTIWQRKKLTTAVVHGGLLVDATALASGNLDKAFEIHAFMSLDFVGTYGCYVTFVLAVIVA